MAKKIRNNHLSVKTVEAKTHGYHCDGHGLYLRVTKSNTRSWMFRYARNGAVHWMGLGPYPDVSLATARACALEARRLLQKGIDPLTEKRVKVMPGSPAGSIAETHTFKECAEAYIEWKSAGWSNPKHAAQWVSTLQTYVYPVMGKVCVSKIDTKMVRRVLDPIWKTKTETASRVRGRVEAVLNWAAAQKWREKENPAQWHGHLDTMLPSAKSVAPVQHFPALPYAKIFEFMQKLKQRAGTAPRALEFLILTGARTNEVLGAKWDEMDFENRVWTVPAERMKGRKGRRQPHAKPLSLDAVRLLRALPRVEGEPFIFPGDIAAQPLSCTAMENVLKRMGCDDITVHGFRSTFRDWSAETTEFPNEVVEMALAHVVANKAEAAYRRGNMLDRRRPLMAQWAAYCRGIEPVSGTGGERPPVAYSVSGNPRSSGVVTMELCA